MSDKGRLHSDVTDAVKRIRRGQRIGGVSILLAIASGLVTVVTVSLDAHREFWEPLDAVCFCLSVINAVIATGLLRSVRKLSP